MRQFHTIRRLSKFYKEHGAWPAAADEFAAKTAQCESVGQRREYRAVLFPYACYLASPWNPANKAIRISPMMTGLADELDRALDGRQSDGALRRTRRIEPIS
jgi:hypothetical protein